MAANSFVLYLIFISVFSMTSLIHADEEREVFTKTFMTKDGTEVKVVFRQVIRKPTEAERAEFDRRAEELTKESAKLPKTQPPPGTISLAGSRFATSERFDVVRAVSFSIIVDGKAQVIESNIRNWQEKGEASPYDFGCRILDCRLDDTRLLLLQNDNSFNTFVIYDGIATKDGVKRSGIESLSQDEYSGRKWASKGEIVLSDDKQSARVRLSNGAEWYFDRSIALPKQ